MIINEMNDGIQVVLQTYASTDTGQIIDLTQRLCQLLENEHGNSNLRSKMIYAVNDYFEREKYHCEPLI